MQIQNKVLENTIISDSEVCYWQLSKNTSYWSSAFIKQLGYDLDDITVKLDFFLNEIIHPEYREDFKDNFFNLVRHNIEFRHNLLLKNRKGRYLEYVCMTDIELDKNHGKSNSNNIYFFKSKINTHEKVRGSNFYYLETADMTNTGSWYVDFEKRKSYIDNITRNILEFADDFIPSVSIGEKIISPKHMPLAMKTFYECATFGQPFDIELLMITANNNKLWARAKGKPVFNESKEIIGLRGVFQNIDERKQNELKIKRSAKIVKSQNSRLFNFAHIVSHNLRSHSSNLSLIIELINETDDIKEKLELIDNLANVSDSLNTTINHLNEVVTVQSTSKKNKEVVSFNDTLDRVCTSINQIISNNHVTIDRDFKDAASINYIPAYMDSIVLNLLTNAIKYKHPKKAPKISIKSYISDKDDDYRTVLEITDNGRGIDMDTFGDKVFGMYKTFHYNEDATGIGLFITKNQIESLNGTIDVKSKVNKGTTFKITF